MSDYIREGPLQLVRFDNAEEEDSGDRIHLDHANLKSVVDKTDGNPLCILCICGPSRQGKSFLLANIVRYLAYLEKGSERDWINDKNMNEPLHGFKFRNGMTSQTKGIWIWSKPFVIKSRLNGDGPISVLVLDTQGTQDEFADAKTMSSIVGLSLLMSSCMIFNVFKQLKEDDLLSLDSYINYGKLVLQAQSSLQDQEEEGSSKPYQKLTFLIRDWNSPFEYPIGSDGGNKFIQEKLKLKSGQSLEAKSTRRNIDACFQSVDCFLMPHPGEKAVLPEFNGLVADLSPPFVEMLKGFMDYYFCSERLPLKHILGNTITAADFQSHLDLYISTFNSPDIPSPHSVMEATIQVVNRNSVQTGIQTYVKFMEKSMKKNKLLKEAELKALDKQGRKIAKSAFSKIRKFGDMNVVNELEEELDENLSREFTLFQKKMKDIRSSAIQEEVTSAFESFYDQVAEQVQFSANNKYLYFEESFITAQGNAVINDTIEQIQDKFDGDSRELSDSLIELQGKLEKVLEERFLWENQARQKMAELAIEKLRRDMGSKYQLQMQETLNNEEVTDVESLDQLHQNVKAEMGEAFLKDKKKFSSKHKSPSKYSRSQSELGATDDILQAKLDRAYESIRTSLLVRIEERAKEESRMDESSSMIPGGVTTSSLQNLSLEDSQFGSSSETIDVAGLQTNSNYGSIPSRVITFDEPIAPTTANPTPVPRQRQKAKGQEDEEKVKQVKEESFNLYEKEMKKQLESKEYVTESELQSFHASSRKLAVNHFKRFDDDGKYDEERDDMLARISSEFSKLELDNTNKVDHAKSDAEKLVKVCHSNYEVRLTESLENVSSLTNLKKCHNKELQSAEDEFKSKCPIKDGQFTSGYISRLKNDIEEIFDEIKDSFKLKLDGAKETAAQTLAIQKEMFSARQLYDDEMSKHFMNNEFIFPQTLDKLHEDISAKCEASCSQKCPLKPAHRAELAKSLNESFQKYKEQNDMNLECEDAAIGIDLGTTYSCVAVYAKGRVRVIPNPLGHNTTPSYVQFKDDGSHVVGDTAKRNAYEDPENTVFDAKRIIGRKIDDPKLVEDMKMWAFTVESERGDPNPKIHVMGKKLYPEQVSSLILKEMKDTASKFLRKPVTKAVITVPAYFTDGQKQATKDAGVLAGLEVLTILTEPVAAAIAYKKQHADRFGERGGKRNILIFDLGGGTFDVAVVVSTEGKLDVLAIGGDDHLGGEDFDRMLMELCAEEFKKSSGVDLFDGKDSTVKQTRDDARRRLKRLQGECEKKKIDLTSGRIAEVTIDSLYQGKDLSVKITRGKFEEVNDALFQSTITAVESTLKYAKLERNQINDIVLVGGSTRIPKIQELLQEFFRGQQLDSSINPDEAVAIGAAMKAAVMNGSITKGSIDFTQIQDVTPMSIGVEVYGGDFSVIIPKGTKIPVKAEERYKTAHNNQTSVQITIYQGEKPKAVENKKLGDFYLNGIPPKDAEVENIDVEMTINAQGILHVNARTSGGDRSGITVTENKDRMSRALIRQLLGDGT